MATIRAKDLPGSITSFGNSDYLAADENASGETRKVNSESIRAGLAEATPSVKGLLSAGDKTFINSVTPHFNVAGFYTRSLQKNITMAPKNFVTISGTTLTLTGTIFVFMLGGGFYTIASGTTINLTDEGMVYLSASSGSFTALDENLSAYYVPCYLRISTHNAFTRSAEGLIIVGMYRMGKWTALFEAFSTIDLQDGSIATSKLQDDSITVIKLNTAVTDYFNTLFPLKTTNYLGESAGYANSGASSVFFGDYSGTNNTGAGNNGIGENSLFNNTGISCNGLGINALRSNIGDNSNGVGSNALYNNSGLSSSGVGEWVLYNNTGDYVNAFGWHSLENNSGIHSNGFGHGALRYNTGSYSNGFGSGALYNNTGDTVNGFGFEACYNNTNNGANAFGNYALHDNSGVAVCAFGDHAGQWNSVYCSAFFGTNTGYANSGGDASMIGDDAGFWNCGTFASAIGTYALKNNEGSLNTAIGGQAFNKFNENTSGTITFDGSAVNLVDQTIYLPAHGLGAVGTYRVLKYTEGSGGVIGGLSGLDVEPYRAIYKFKIIHANYIQVYTRNINDNSLPLLTSAGGTGHTLTPQYIYSRSTAIGYDAEPSKSNQIVLGDKYVTSMVTNAAINFELDTSDNDVYAVSFPQIGTKTVGLTIAFLAGHANTSICYLNLNNTGGIEIKKRHDQTLATGDIEAGQIVVVVWDGSFWQMISQLAQ